MWNILTWWFAKMLAIKIVTFSWAFVSLSWTALLQAHISMGLKGFLVIILNIWAEVCREQLNGKASSRGLKSSSRGFRTTFLNAFPSKFIEILRPTFAHVEFRLLETCFWTHMVNTATWKVLLLRAFSRTPRCTMFQALAQLQGCSYVDISSSTWKD